MRRKAITRSAPRGGSRRGDSLDIPHANLDHRAMFHLHPDTVPERHKRSVIPVAPPTPVLVDLSRAVHAPDDKLIGHSPIWLRTAGVDIVAPDARGLLHGWVRSAHGGWLGIVELELRTRDDQVTLRLTHLCPTASLRPA